MTIDVTLRQAAQDAVATVMRQCKGVRAVLVSTEDGFDVASQVENTAQVSRLSAMASSLGALGTLAGAESQLGVCNYMVMQAAEGYITVSHIRRTDMILILSIIAGNDAIMGQVLFFSKQAAERLQVSLS